MPKIKGIPRVTDDEIIAHLADGRVVSVPLAWSWRLSEATRAQRTNFRIIGTGQGVHWPDLDEDLSVEGMLHGIPAPRPAPGHKRRRAGPRPWRGPKSEGRAAIVDPSCGRDLPVPTRRPTNPKPPWVSLTRRIY